MRAIVTAAALLATLLVVGASAAVPATPMPTLPPPKFDGYIGLAQYRCMDFLCKEWSMGVTRLATECFTWGCKYEQKHLNELVGTAPTVEMSFTILTGFDHTNRNFYTLGLVMPARGEARLWTSSIAGNVNSSSVKQTAAVKFPWSLTYNPLVAMEVHPTTGEPIVIFADGTVGTLALNGTFTTRAKLLTTDTTRQLTQASDVNVKAAKLYILATVMPGFSTNNSWPSVLTVDLATWKKVGDFNTTVLPAIAPAPFYFEMNWIPQLSHLVVFATGNFDSVLYLNPATGNTTIAILSLSDSGNFVTYFSDNENTKTLDTAQNSAYDEKQGYLYFQAHVYSDSEGISSLMAVGPFVEGPPQPLYWTNEAISPMNFGYQGMHFIHCEGACPT